MIIAQISDSHITQVGGEARANSGLYLTGRDICHILSETD
jgi:hypothetical protein